MTRAMIRSRRAATSSSVGGGISTMRGRASGCWDSRTNTAYYANATGDIGAKFSYNLNNFKFNPRMRAGEGVEQEGTNGAGGGNAPQR